MVYVVTNYGGSESYTPAVFEHELSAMKEWFGLVIHNLYERDYITHKDLVHYQSLYQNTENTKDMNDLITKIKHLNIANYGITSNGVHIGEDGSENVIEFFETEIDY